MVLIFSRMIPKMAKYITTKAERDYKKAQYRLAYEKTNGRCEKHTTKRANQIAHGIPQRDWLKTKYSYQVIHHVDNLHPACSERCNHKQQIRPWEWEETAFDIAEKIKEE